ncbi:MAG: DUF3450 domain-containing protein [Colwellia sp.]|nr:DUF3450 domain-containing protein [Colwellia sp.]
MGISLVYQTRDGSKLGLWHQQNEQWQSVSQDYRLGINKALRIARKQLSTDLIFVPLPQTETSTAE